MDYIENLTAAGRVAARALTDKCGGYRAQPCLVFSGVPAWIMPNGAVRVGSPDAPAMAADAATRAIRALGDGRAPCLECGAHYADQATLERVHRCPAAAAVA